MNFPNIKPVQYMTALALVFLANSIFASDYNVYFSDPSAGLIYGMENDDTTQIPAVVSGQLSINSSHVVQLDNNHVITSMEYYPNSLWEINFLNNSMTEIEGLPEGCKVAALGTGISTFDFSILVYFSENTTLQIYSGDKIDGSWAITSQGTPFPTESWGQYCQVIKQLNEIYLVKHYEAIETVDMNGSPQNTMITTCEYETEHIVAEPYRSGNWYHYNEYGRFNYHFSWDTSTYKNTIIPDNIYGYWQYPHAEFTLWQYWEPYFVAKAGNQIYTGDPYSYEYTGLTYSAHTGDGSTANPVELEKDISATHSYFFAARDTWDCYDSFRHEFFTINTDSDTLTKRIIFQVGEGPSLGTILAMDTSPNGQIHVLCQQLDKLEIISIDPSTGDRTLLASDLSRDFLPAISRESDTTFHLFKETGVDNSGTLETTLELCELTLGSQLDNYTTASITSLHANVTPQDLSFSENGEGSALYTSRQDTFFAQSSGSTFSTYPAVSGHENLQSRQVATLPSGGMELYGTFPPSIWDYTPDTSSLSQIELFYEVGAQFLPDLDFPSDFACSPDGATFYLSSFLSPKIYAIDGSSGETTVFSNERPNGLTGDKWGAPAMTEPVICCGIAIHLPGQSKNSSSASSWFQQ